MRAFAAVFGREIFERRVVFVVAFAAGFVPLIVSLATGWSRPDAAELRVLVALVGASALSTAFAILLGAAVIAGETKEKRISFFFARPIPSVSLWAGKLLAAIAITLATAFLAFTPGWLSGNGRARSLWGLDATAGRTALAALVLAFVLVLGSHAVVTIARLRSPWVALDLILAPTLVFLAAVFVRLLVRATDPYYWAELNPAELALGTLAASLLFALLLATFFQVAEGRSDARRAHGAFSVVLFGTMGLAVASVGAYAAWCGSARATDITGIAGGVQASPGGIWLAVGGPLRAGRGAGAFLWNPSINRSIRTRGFNPLFSHDGSRAAWGEPQSGFFERKGRSDEVFVADLASGRATATGLEAPDWSSLALSPTGRRLAVLDGKTLAAYDMTDAANPKQLAVFPVLAGGRGFAFVDEDTIRLFPRLYSTPNRKDIPPAGLEVAEFSLPSKKSLVTGRFEREALPRLYLTPDARFLVGRRPLTDEADGRAGLTLHDGRSGDLVATITDALANPQIRFLSGGRVAVSGIAGASARVLFFESEEDFTAPTRTIELGSAGRAQIGGEIPPGRIVVALRSTDRRPQEASWISGWRCVSVDLVTGAVSPLGEKLYPVNTWAWWGTMELSMPDATRPVPSLFLDADGRLVRLDPATGARTVLLGKGK